MKIKTFAAILFFSAGAVNVAAQDSNCNANSSISHEAVRAGNFKDAYIPWRAVLDNCPLLRFYTYADGFKILQGFLDADNAANDNKRTSANYEKYFNELMEVHDIRMKYIPQFQAKMKGVPTIADAIGIKSIAYLTYAPSVNINQVYSWLKQAVDEGKGESSGTVLHYFLETSLNKLKKEPAHQEQFIKDYLIASQYIQDALDAETKEANKQNLIIVKENAVAMFINSGAASCSSLQEIYGPKVEANKTNMKVLQEALDVMKMMGCTEEEAYLQASLYAYRIEPTVDAALGCAYMAYKKGEFDGAVKFFDEAINLESDNTRKADLAYRAAAVLTSAKKLSQARAYAQKALDFDENFGKAHILIATLYATSPNWNEEVALNKCTYFVVIDRLQRAKSVDPSVAEEANKLIGTYSRYTPAPADLFMLGYKAGDRITVGGWIGETTTIR
jgi:tetratricopeptide (TPR) repeat protein